ncbi:hypothetical protein FUAX_16170 [Fulvitalea axinellae]|uniref:DUF58 domain-containing protein n=1 Tax=Fulvitalea axinellae TaxID=1182444 RepID=A0AAU9CIR5_9BACT|nr:hypothetical protein FUAX_16170 [Fulvitalea axinellae]
MGGPKHNEEALDPELFMAMDDLELVARGVVEGALSGVHRSKFVGFSNEFDSHRQYMPGDDLKHVNWNLWGKTDRLYVKQYESDTNLNLYLVVDTSKSMIAENGPHSKWAYAKRASAAMAYLATKLRDTPGLCMLCGKEPVFVEPKARSGHFFEILATLESKTPETSLSIYELLDENRSFCSRPGIVILFSDLFDQDKELLDTLETYTMMGHEVIIFQILDDWEKNLPEDEEMIFHDLETGEKLKVNTSHIREKYEREVRKWAKNFKEESAGKGIDFISVSTSDPLADILTVYLNKRCAVF